MTNSTAATTTLSAGDLNRVAQVSMQLNMEANNRSIGKLMESGQEEIAKRLLEINGQYLELIDSLKPVATPPLPELVVASVAAPSAGPSNR